MGKKIRIRQGKRHRIKLHVYVYVLIEANNTSFFSEWPTRPRRTLGKKTYFISFLELHICVLITQSLVCAKIVTTFILLTPHSRAAPHSQQSLSFILADYIQLALLHFFLVVEIH